MEKMRDLTEPIIKQLSSIQYEVGDVSDLGNEIGIAIGNQLSGENLQAFISGLRHGISLIDGTHFK